MKLKYIKSHKDFKPKDPSNWILALLFVCLLISSLNI